MEREPFCPIETARLSLRCVATDDVAQTSVLMTPAVSRWLAYWPVPFTLDMAVARVVHWRELAFSHQALPFAVIERASGLLVGWVIVSRDDENSRRGSLGFWLGEKYHGHGFMKELLPKVIAAGFEWLDLDAIEAGAQPDNAGSLALMRACGMTPSRGAFVFTPARSREEYCEFYEIKRAV